MIEKLADLLKFRDRVHDAELETASWKETASRWRKRAIREGGVIRRKMKEVESALAKSERVASKLSSEVERLRAELKEAQKADARIEAARKNATDAREAQMASERRTEEARLQMQKLREEVAKNDQKPSAARARMRVFATRLGIDQKWPGYNDDEELAAECDRRLFELQQKANGVPEKKLELWDRRA